MEIRIVVTLIAAIRIVVIRILETRILETRILETQISAQNVRVQISVQNVVTRIWAPIGVRCGVRSAVRFVVRYVVGYVRYPADLEHVSHRHQASLAEPRELERAVRPLRCSGIQQAQAHSLFVAAVAVVGSVAFVASAFVGVPASVLALGRGRYASAAVHHQARHRAIVEQRQSDAE